MGLGVPTRLFTIYWPDYYFPWPECRHLGSSNSAGTISNASTTAQRELKSSKIEEIDLPAKHLDYFIWSHKSSINQSQSHVCAQPRGCRNRDHQKITRVFICRLTKHYMSYKALYDTLSWVYLHHCVCKQHTWANTRRCLPGRRGFAETRLAGLWCSLMVGWIRPSLASSLGTRRLAGYFAGLACVLLTYIARRASMLLAHCATTCLLAARLSYCTALSACRFASARAAHALCHALFRGSQCCEPSMSHPFYDASRITTGDLQWHEPQEGSTGCFTVRGCSAHASISELHCKS